MRALSILTLGLAPLIASAFSRPGVLTRHNRPKPPELDYPRNETRSAACIHPQIVRSGERWWELKQSAESIAWHRERAFQKRWRRMHARNPSRYAQNNPMLIPF